MRIVGDVHGHIDKYVDIVKEEEYSLQIGDMGFDYSGLAKLDCQRHKFIGGNHDNYDVYHANSYSLGDYGNMTLGGIKFFFIRGAFSIDWKPREIHRIRTGRISWWADEQLLPQELNKAIDLYEMSKPDIMVTHTCPQELARLIGKPGVLKMFGFRPETFSTDTQLALQTCLDIHKPAVWYYGHFHQDRVDNVRGCDFVCLDELSYVDIK